MAIFKSFRSTVSPFIPRKWFAGVHLLVDPVTGAPTGIQNFNDSGADGIWAPIDLTAAQVAAPTPAMIADLNATYRLNVPPYTRYTSNVTGLMETATGNIQGPNGLWGNMLVYAPFTVTDPAGVAIEGAVHVVNFVA